MSRSSHSPRRRLGVLAGLLFALPVLASAAPTVTLTSPTAGSTSSYPGAFTVSASVTSSANIQYVEFFANGVSIGVDPSAPYSKVHSNLALGSYTYTAVATDVFDASGESAPRTVSVVNSANVAPTISIVTPVNGDTAVAPATFGLTVSTGDSDGAVASVQFLDGATVLATDIKAPFEYTHTGVTAGTHVYKAIATDNQGATTTSATATVTVTSPPNAPPTVTLVSPATGSWAAQPGSFQLSANASDAGGIAKVEFKSNGAVVFTDTVAPYAYTLSGLAQGTYSITATATDTGGATATSAASTVTVNAPVVAVATRRYVYDQYRRLCKTINPESGSTIVDYDAAGNVAWKAEGLALPSTTSCDRTLVAEAQKTIYAYDERNRVLSVSTPDGNADVDTTYYADGKVASVIAANPGGAFVTTSYVYNKRRLLTGESSENGTTLYSLGYAYDANGNLGTVTYPDGQSVSYWPDALGRTTKVGVNGGQTYASGITYYPGGAIAGFTFGNGAVHAMTRNNRNLPTRSRDTYCTGGVATCATPAVILDDTYAFDGNGNVTDITDQAQAGKTTRGMAYDGMDRLTTVVSPGQWGNATYTYDALDNLRSADQGTRQYRYNYATNNRLATIKDPAGATIFTFGYDVNGNTLSKAGATTQNYVFDSANRMSQVTGKETYRYDGLGRRVQTTDANGDTTFWIYSQGGQVMYTSEARRKQNIAYIFLGNTQVATRTVTWAPNSTTAVRYQHTDSLGSPVAESDSSGAISDRNAFAPYGQAYSDANTTTVVDGTGYTGHVMDKASGLTYMQQRYYDPQIGRFMSIDPDSVETDNAVNFTRYAYANNNPYRFVDPDGRTSKPVPEPRAGSRINSVASSSRKAFAERQAKVERAVAAVAKLEKMTAEYNNVLGGGGVRYNPDMGWGQAPGGHTIEIGTKPFEQINDDVLKAVAFHELWHVKQVMHGGDTHLAWMEQDAFDAELRFIEKHDLKVPAAYLQHVTNGAKGGAIPQLTKGADRP